MTAVELDGGAASQTVRLGNYNLEARMMPRTFNGPPPRRQTAWRHFLSAPAPTTTWSSPRT